MMILLDLGSLGCWLGKLEDKRGTTVLVWALSDDGSSGAVQRTCQSWELVAPFSIDRRRKKDRVQRSEALLVTCELGGELTEEFVGAHGLGCD